MIRTSLIISFFLSLADQGFQPGKDNHRGDDQQKACPGKPYTGLLIAFGFSRYYKGLELVKKY
jgi:hypothetical protein